ncbi:virulence factor SrfB [Orrella marina]|uniref:Virulence factor SrfB n=1 Tax=Orrella marina TaxID=2163011 RepID=A0A2R4XME7_9BURK|nr:virulence factor SrfB [Orrella marina]AWB34941.1 virulence factor SrfB [Orrella marina]
MLAEITSFEEQTALIMDSGVQFLDFAATFSLKGRTGAFVLLTQAGPAGKLLENERDGRYYLAPDTSKSFKPQFELDLDESLKLFDGRWLPAPFFRCAPGRQFEQGPLNWARMRVVRVPGDDLGHTHRITLAFDTKVLAGRQDTTYLSPTMDDVLAGSSFALAHQTHEIGWFLDQKWVADWLAELYQELAGVQIRRDAEEVQLDLQGLHHQAHYLNLLDLVGASLDIPEIKLISNTPSDLYRPIMVDMVLDVGNSRSCGILIEDHPQESDGLRRRYELALRDLSQPERVYRDPFESRIEFAQASFGKENFSAQSGRTDAFLWPTIVRVGQEAARLGALRRGTEGATGLSSPKRYLWDTDSFEPGWRFNTASLKLDSEPYATAAPLSSLINELGEALYTLDPDERMPVFHPHYSRSSLMMLMLSEVVVQALTQMNSPAQRLRQSHSRMPRHLRTIILTVPPSMPQPEREIFRRRMHQAIGVVWKSMGWHAIDADPDDESAQPYPPFPEVHLQWDEATGSQAVYLFSEIQNKFGGRAQEFFLTLARSDQPARHEARQPCVSVATIDIGGGTTDLVINDYFLDRGERADQASGDLQSMGSGAYIVPQQRFRDGFRVAGDDIVLDVLRFMVVPQITHAIAQAGVPDAEAMVSQLMGSEPLNVHESLLRQQLTLQVLYPLGLRIIKEYERHDPLEPGHLGPLSIRDLLAGHESASPDVLEYVERAVSRSASPEAAFSLMDVMIDVRLDQLHQRFLRGEFNICKTLQALSEVVWAYRPDVLLLSGRPSRLPGVIAYIRSLQALPVSRIVPMHHYRAGAWYPFHRNGRIDDPKSTAAVGAMICLLSKDLRLPNFFFRSAAFVPYSTVRYLGLIDNNNAIKTTDVFYSDIRLDDPDYQFPDQSFEVRGSMRIGFRQLPVERWPASPLYKLVIEDRQVREKLSSQGLVLKVSLRRSDRFMRESFEIASVEGASRNKLSLKLNTMADAGFGETHYWLDSGSVR